MIEVNFFEVLLAAVASMAIGFFWYSQAFLGKPWMKEKGFTKESLKKAQAEMGKLYGLSFVIALISGYVLAHVMGLSSAFYGYSAVQTGLTSAFWMWLGFMMPVQVAATIFGEKKWKLLGIDTGYQLASVLAMGLVIGLM